MDYAALRKKMIQEQLVSRGIKNERVLDAFLKVERHKFVPGELDRSAYEDFPLPIGEGQTISQPYIVALMTECMDLKGTEKVLEIGTGSGYQTAILAELTKEVYSIERIACLGQRAEEIIAKLGYKNVRIKIDDGTLGWKDASPFERIIITAATPRIPLPLTEELSDAGKMILPLGENFSQVLTVVEKNAGRLESVQVCGCVFVPLVGKYGTKNENT